MSQMNPQYEAHERFCKSIGDMAKENERLQESIKLLEAVINDPHALWANWLRGSVTLPVGIGDVREHQERIKQLEESLESANTLLQLVMCEQNHLRDLRNAANDRIKRLEEACGEMVSEEDTYVRLQIWIKAKEAKP